ncbi:Ankyrin repeat and EF-hand domain-containing protein 1 [Fasciola hepatica]|uniref:Ankyrin repeat and EF-hand domain-containing protein 1 n=1 Tax=Fasciola hepatica TaxID=6192 RepID=A0A4E0QY20_FASHE|nr:Ankyrin repeat and EF-hand domain-containing protein 1 [Fasciola hepatica]
MPVACSHLERIQLRKMFQCVRDGAADHLAKIVLYGVPNIINYNDPDIGVTPLIVAVQENRIHMLKVKIVDFEGRTALMRAAVEGNVELFHSLLESKANRHAIDLAGENVLFHCIFPTERHLHCLRLVLLDKIDVNLQNKNGETVLYRACKKAKENEEFILELLKCDADPNLQTIRGRTALMEACQTDSVLVITGCVLQGANLELSDKQGNRAIHEASRVGQLKALFALSAFGADFKAVDKKGNTALHYAAASSEQCCKFLGQRGCDARIKNEDGQLPRNVATEQGKKLCVRELRKLERTSGKLIKNANPKLIRLYDWSVTRANEISARFLELAEYLAIETERVRTSQLEEVALSAMDMTSTDQIPLTAVGGQEELDTARTVGTEQTATTRDSSKTRGKGKRTSRRGRKGASGIGGVSVLEPIKRLSKDDMETVFQSLQAPYDSYTMWSELMKLHEKNGDASVDWAEFMTGKKYVNKAYMVSAFEGKKGGKKKSKKGGKARKSKIPFEISTLPEEAIYRRADGGPPIMYIPKQSVHTDLTRFNAEAPPSHPFQDDSSWYLNEPKRQYISFHAAAKNNDLASIRLAITEGYPVDTRDKFYKTPLMMAAHHGSLEAAMVLVGFG